MPTAERATVLATEAMLEALAVDSTAPPVDVPPESGPPRPNASTQASKSFEPQAMVRSLAAALGAERVTGPPEAREAPEDRPEPRPVAAPIPMKPRIEPTDFGPSERAMLPELLARIREDSTYPYLAADWLCRAFHDCQHFTRYLAVCKAAWEGSREPAALVAAYEWASAEGVADPGAVFLGGL